MSRIDGRVCVVTGAGAGIGRELAIALGRRGARLAISDIDEPALAETAALLAPLGTEVHDRPLDVADQGQFETYADEVADRFGVVHQVYNNAGIWLVRSVLDSTYDDFREVFSIDLWGVIHGTKAFLPHVIASGDGHVINMSSLNGLLGQGNTSHYCTAKFAVHGFTESLRMELRAAGHPVHALSVHPGGIHTTIASTALRKALGEGEELSERDLRLERLYNDVILRGSPAKAATTILRAVERNKHRVLVGPDAKILDLAVRAAPSLTHTIVGAALKRLWR